MTQRVDLATVMDRLAIDSLLTEYARALDAGDWGAFRRLFVPGGHVDHPCAEDPAEHPATDTDAVDRLAAALAPYPTRQHFLVNRLLSFDLLEHDEGDTARVDADYLAVLYRADGSVDAAPDVEHGGRYAFLAVRTREGWRLREALGERMWRRARTTGDSAT
jgi:hypothetical protein